MKKFLVLYRSTMATKDQMAELTPESGKAEMARWMAWGGKTGAALVDWGAPLGETAELGGTSTGAHLSGYSIVQAESMAAAKALMDGHPHYTAPGASIALVEIMPMPGA